MQAFLDEAKQNSRTQPLRISVRQLLSYWNAKRRGYWIVEQIQEDLNGVGLTTNPPFDDVWIDSYVDIVPVEVESPGINLSVAEASPVSEESGEDDVYLRVGSLSSANSGVVSVSPHDTVRRAQSLMLRHDYSQLAVLSGERDLRGAVSWESIAQAAIRNSDLTLSAVTQQPEIVREEDDLLAQIPRIISANFVFVQAHDKRIIGIVTTADISKEFAQTANPFFVIGEIERRLRRILDATFSADELASVRDSADTKRVVRKADHLTFGEYVRILENPGNWDKLKWNLDRRTFIEALHEVRILRNEVMHFSPDPLDEDAVAILRNFAQWLRKISPR